MPRNRCHAGSAPGTSREYASGAVLDRRRRRILRADRAAHAADTRRMAADPGDGSRGRRGDPAQLLVARTVDVARLHRSDRLADAAGPLSRSDRAGLARLYRCPHMGLREDLRAASRRRQYPGGGHGGRRELRDCRSMGVCAATRFFSAVCWQGDASALLACAEDSPSVPRRRRALTG